MSTFTLKMIAIIAMLIDHIGAIFISPSAHPELYVLFRGIGRLAFPIFVFMVVEGYYHTRDVKKYLKRLGIFALISEIPFDLAFYQVHFNTNVITDIRKVFDGGYHEARLEALLGRFNQDQNVFFTLFIGLLLIYLMSMVETKYANKFLISNLIDAALTVGACAIAYLLRTDYSIAGILIFVSFYLFRGSKIMISICLFIICGTVLSSIKDFQETGDFLAIISMLATFAMIPIAFYNGKKGKNAKYIFYIFYPAHLLLLFVIKQFI
ncbi:MAG TPA: TraX family protein [Mobilitalea sp.]|nr:TraX family protein [Mobilitalea sp.]